MLAWVDPVRYSTAYDSVHGQDVAFLVHLPCLRVGSLVTDPDTAMLGRSLDQARAGMLGDVVREKSEQLRDFLVCVLLSPLPATLKTFVWQLITAGSPFTIPNWTLTANERVVLYALALALRAFMPTEENTAGRLFDFLSDLAALPDNVAALVTRAGNRYGIHVVDHLSPAEAVLGAYLRAPWFQSTPQDTSRMKVHVLEVEPSLYANDDALYRHVCATINSGFTFLFIKGVVNVSDRFIKWCAEFSFRRPWVYIVFQVR